jgi:MFS family permease
MFAGCSNSLMAMTNVDPHDANQTGIVRTIFIARTLRDFGDSFIAILLPFYLTTLGLSPLQIGIVATVALLGSATITLGIGMFGGRYDHRSLLIAASLLMVMTGAAFIFVTDYAILLLVALVGTANPSSGSVSIFVPLEHTILTHQVAAVDRTAMFARYSLFGALSGALGALAAGIPDYVSVIGLDRLVAIKVMFALYALLGIAGGLFYMKLPCQTPPPTTTNASGVVNSSGLGPSKNIVFQLAALFSIDAFAGGFVVQSLLTLWLFESFDLSLIQAGQFFFWSGILSAFSFPVAVWLSKRVGLVNTMVYTHIPASLCLIAAALIPSLPIVLALLLIRSALSQMDVPARSSYVMAVVTPAERPAAASFTAVPRSLASALSPALAGALFAGSFKAWPLIICGVLKIIYDLLLLARFRHIKPPEEKQ